MPAPDLQLEQSSTLVVATPALAEISHLDMQDLVDQLTLKHRHDNAHSFILDLSAVQFLASACIGVLVQFLQDLEPSRGRIALACCQPNVQFLFKVTRLDQVFPMYEDLADAKAALTA
jgi:anti-anti-sigma factor